MFDFDIQYMDYIMGEKFPSICENTICYYTAKNKITGSTLYADTYCKDEVLDYVRSHPNTFFKIVFHNSDWSCPDNIPPNCIVYSQNVAIEQLSNNVHSLPIGLENSKWFNHIGKLQKLQKIIQKQPTKLCYCNFNVGTNIKIREPAKSLTQKPYFTQDMHHNGYDFVSYINNIVNHFYVLSPPGNGIDCHRTWETLYLKRVPIIYNVYKTDLFDELPVLLINNVEELTQEFLEHNKNIILQKKYNFEKLKMSYWINKINT